MKNKHIFLLIPERCGSGILWKHLAALPQISSMKRGEGQSYFHNQFCGMKIEGKLGPINMIDGPSARHSILFSNEKNYDWGKIIDIWNIAWNKNSTKKTLFLEKSPPNLFRYCMLNKFFENAYFIVSLRNPYAAIHGWIYAFGNMQFIPGNGNLYTTPDKEFINFTIDWFKFANQAKVALQDLEHIIYISYEDICDNDTEQTKKIFTNFMPELENLDFNCKVKCSSSIDPEPSYKNLYNYNHKKIAQLTTQHINLINDTILGKIKAYENFLSITERLELLQFFNYEMI